MPAWSAAEFLRPRKREERALRDLLTAHQDCRAGVAGTGRDGGNAEHHRQDERYRSRAHALAHPDEVAIGKMTGFMSEHAGQLVRRIQRHDEPGMDKHVLAFGDEGVERRIIDDVETHRVRRHARGLKQRIQICPHHALDLGVADERRGRPARKRKARAPPRPKKWRARRAPRPG